MGRTKKDPNAIEETRADIVKRVKVSGALSPAMAAALDEVAAQFDGLEDELKKVRSQFRVLTKT